MLTLYMIAAVIGGGLILVSLLGAGHHEAQMDAGGGHFDAHGDAHIDAQADASSEVQVDASSDAAHDLSTISHENVQFDAHGHAGHVDSGGHTGPWIPFFSLRFWTYMIGVFGVVGLLLTRLTPVGEPVTAALSAGCGLICGLSVSGLMFWLTGHEADSTAREQDFLGKSATVTVAVREGLPGRVRCVVKGEILDLIAKSEEAQALEAGSEVVIVSMDGTTVQVVRQDRIFE